MPTTHAATIDEMVALLPADAVRIAGIIERTSGIEFVFDVDEATNTIAGGTAIDTYRDLCAPFTIGQIIGTEPSIADDAWAPLPALV